MNTKWAYGFGQQSNDSKGRPVWGGKWGYWSKTGYWSKVSHQVQLKVNTQGRS